MLIRSFFWFERAPAPPPPPKKKKLMSFYFVLMKFEGGDRSISGIYGKEVGMKFNHLEKPPPLPRIQGTCFGSFILYCPFSCIHILWRREVKSGLAEQWIRNLGGRGNENNPFVEKPFLLRNHDEPNYASHPENFIISGGESQILPRTKSTEFCNFFA